MAFWLAFYQFCKAPTNRIEPLHFAFPNHDSPPAQSAKQPGVESVTPFVPIKFCVPVLSVASRPSALPTVVAMPKASLHLNNRSVAWQNDVRVSRQILPMESESKAARMKQASDLPLGLSVFAANATHNPTSLRF